MKNYIGFKAFGMGFNAHMTLLYTGDLTPDKEQEVNSILIKHEAFYWQPVVERKNIALFGPNKDIPVLEVIVPDDLLHVRDSLIASGVPSPSEYEWNPHITLRLDHPQTLRLPRLIKLGELDIY